MHAMDEQNKLVRIHYLLPLSYANGPGKRSVFWLPGCLSGYAASGNPTMHASYDGGTLFHVDYLLRRVQDLGDTIEGVTIAGGEPLEQYAAIYHLLWSIKEHTSLSVVLCTGYSMDALVHQGYAELLAYVDVLIVECPEANLSVASLAAGCDKPQFHFITERYSVDDMLAVPSSEVIITRDGDVIVTGMHPLQW
jgi:anaerobic ribonucleoside-triphosphate reductase activating protein